MKTEDILLVVLLVAVMGALLFAVSGFAIAPETGAASGKTGGSTDTGYTGSTGIKQSASGFRTISTGSTGQGDVQIDITPQGADNGRLAVDIAVNTHSVDTSQFDLGRMTTLEYNNKLLNPSSYPSLSGHHANGVLVFDVGEELAGFTIRIKGIPQVEERVFEWG